MAELNTPVRTNLDLGDIVDVASTRFAGRASGLDRTPPLQDAPGRHFAG